MKKILLFTDTLSSGGAQRQLVNLAVLLKEKGYEVLMLDYWDSTFYDDFLNAHKVSFNHCNIKGKWNIIKMFKHQLDLIKPDVVISYLDNPCTVSCIAKLTSKQYFKLIVSERNTTQRITLSTIIKFYLFRSADVVVPNSQTQYEFINKRFSFLRKKNNVITNFLDTETFHPNTSVYKKHQCLVVGRVVEQKNVIKFIKAIKNVVDKFPNFTIDWYGEPHPRSYFDECIELINSLSLNDNFHFYPAINNIVEQYQSSDFFVLPSIYEGFPNVLCEAMSCGLPVIASNVCDNPNIMVDGCNGYLFNPMDIDDIANKIIKYLSLNEDIKNKMREQSRLLATEKFSKQIFVNKYIKIIES